MKPADVEVVLEPVDRRNYRKLFTMQPRPEQTSFVTPPRWTLARCYVRLFGDRFEHLPHLIVAAGEVVGYATTVCDPSSADDYWIDDIMIDAAHQGKGYGRAGLTETIRMIAARYPRCRAVQLTCFRANTNAAALYQTLGFEPTGGVDEEFSEPNYKLSGAALAKFRK
ncbi:GNAT family N-acetyltransferase [Candidatus Binatus sp.]|uniref:GNAT family N-acetyltransferase n=1 Tax=Candidatus Binatus sp. TaxID=2811406 RepID=UPI002F93A4EB